LRMHCSSMLFMKVFIWV